MSTGLPKIQNNKLLTYLVLYIIIFINSLGGVFSKLGSSKPFFSFEWIVLYGLLLLTLVIYAVFWQQVLKKMPLNTAYTIKSVGVIWTLLWGHLIFHEKISIMNLFSISFIVAGVILMTTSKEAKKEEKRDE